MDTYTLIKPDGTRQQVPFLMKNNVPYVSEHIAKHEVMDKWTQEVVIFEPTIECFEEARRMHGKPLMINSGYRTQAYEDHLKAIGYKAVKDSPHTRGACLDLAIPSGTTYLYLRNLLRQAAKNLGLPTPRAGYKEYGYSFVHGCDFVFMLFDPYIKGEVNPHPDYWTRGYEW